MRRPAITLIAFGARCIPTRQICRLGFHDTLNNLPIVRSAAIASSFSHPFKGALSRLFFAPTLVPRRRSKFILLGIVVALALVGYVRRKQIALMLPMTEGLLMPYERGFGDTVLQYSDRS